MIMTMGFVRWGGRPRSPASPISPAVAAALNPLCQFTSRSSASSSSSSSAKSSLSIKPIPQSSPSRSIFDLQSSISPASSALTKASLATLSQVMARRTTSCNTSCCGSPGHPSYNTSQRIASFSLGEACPRGLTPFSGSTWHVFFVAHRRSRSCWFPQSRKGSLLGPPSCRRNLAMLFSFKLRSFRPLIRHGCTGNTSEVTWRRERSTVSPAGGRDTAAGGDTNSSGQQATSTATPAERLPTAESQQ
mmetsp:Transcript_123486/g.349016  ORF Transcript_123486/g.349016 Transcript_123486/m.349016 type:complete len:247 (-) Transcript_123486:514-1254(-)